MNGAQLNISIITVTIGHNRYRQTNMKAALIVCDMDSKTARG